jgi:hypothetical protein
MSGCVSLDYAFQGARDASRWCQQSQIRAQASLVYRLPTVTVVAYYMMMKWQ